MDFLLIFFLLGAVGTWTASQFSRSAKLTRLAHRYGCNFELHRSSVITALSAGKLEFFTRFFHQFDHVFTFTTQTAFTRLADAAVFINENPDTKPFMTTLFTAEMRKTQFPYLKIAPANSLFAPSQHAPFSLPTPPLAARYRVYADPQAQTLLTPFVLGLLKEKDNLYLEVNELGFVYHEHTLIAPEQMDEFRFRALKILNELEKSLPPTAGPNKDGNPSTQANRNPADDLQAQAWLESFTNSASQPAAGPGQNFRMFWFLLVLVLFLGITFFSWFVLHHWVGR